LPKVSSPFPEDPVLPVGNSNRIGVWAVRSASIPTWPNAAASEDGETKMDVTQDERQVEGRQVLQRALDWFGQQLGWTFGPAVLSSFCWAWADSSWSGPITSGWQRVGIFFTSIPVWIVLFWGAGTTSASVFRRWTSPGARLLALLGIVLFFFCFLVAGIIAPRLTGRT
jgi:hypothetical protein